MLSPLCDRKYYILIGMLVSLILLALFQAPVLYRLLAAEGREYLFAPAYSLQHLSCIFVTIFLRFAAPFPPVSVI